MGKVLKFRSRPAEPSDAASAARPPDRRAWAVIGELAACVREAVNEDLDIRRQAADRQ